MPVRRAALLLLFISESHAAPLRPFFEPTDLELEDPGTLDIDVQTGPTYGASAWGHRWILTDLELDLGLRDNVELDIDATFSSDLQDDRSRAIASEALWPSMKLGLADTVIHDHGFACGIQLGPRIPMFTGAGVGYAALGLGGWAWRRWHVVLNGGFLYDPGPHPTHGRTAGGLFGVDVALDIDAEGHFMITSEIGGSAFANGSGEAHQTIGLAWEPYADRLQFSVVLLTGISPNGDRGALFFGVSPKVDLF